MYFAGLTGGSGTGKSTTLRLMAGLLAPDRGEVVVQGVPRRGLASDDTSIVKCECYLSCTIARLFRGIQPVQGIRRCGLASGDTSIVKCGTLQPDQVSRLLSCYPATA